MQLRIVTIVVSLVGPLSVWAHAEEDSRSGHVLLRHCEAALHEQSSDFFGAGRCIGILETLPVVRWRASPDNRVTPTYCPPLDYTLEQEARIVVDYLKGHPEKLHQRGVLLALEALHEAFPCK